MTITTPISFVRAIWLIAAVLLGGCATLPNLEGRTASTAVTDTATTRLGKMFAAATAAQPDQSGIYPLPMAKDSFAARGLLARTAERSLDVQYYIWHADTTGCLLLEELWNAAERGVRVRLLLDDNGIAGLDPILAALDSHVNVEVRLFNPFANRRFKAFGYVTDFSRLNRRMHNKSFTADTQATIVGGRNIGDEYFGAGDAMVFADLDVVAVGHAVGEVATAFDLYWNSDAAYPLELIVERTDATQIAAMHAKFAEVRASADAVIYLEALTSTKLAGELRAKELPLEWTQARLVCDPPQKVLGESRDADLLLTHLLDVVGTPQHQVDLVSPYFVPGKDGTKALSALSQRGVKLRILTNSLAATDVGAVHAGYAKRREPLLRSGAQIYELKPDARGEVDKIDANGDKGGGPSVGGSHGGSSSASLHAKTFAVDRNRVFVGSFNFDPRSARLNTEMGLVIDSVTLANAMSNHFDSSLSLIAYEVVLSAEGGGLEWIERTQNGEMHYHKEPKTSFFKRFSVGFMSILPIEWLL